MDNAAGDGHGDHSLLPGAIEATPGLAIHELRDWLDDDPKIKGIYFKFKPSTSSSKEAWKAKHR